MRARLQGDRIALQGVMPWVTGAAQASHFITGATLDDGRQIMLVLPATAAGVRIGPPLELMALAGSLTSEVYCDDVVVDRRWLLAGPSEQVLAGGKGGTGGLETSALALGLAAACIDFLQQEAAPGPDLIPIAERLAQNRLTIGHDLLRLAQADGTPEAAVALRARANALVLRSSQATLTASKGAGFVKNHPAQRWARQALFFLVWSCPRPTAEATLKYLITPGGDACS
jgi:alkylation response protein AidB-like acyl-CoA dehydrogenase